MKNVVCLIYVINCFFLFFIPESSLAWQTKGEGTHQKLSLHAAGFSILGNCTGGMVDNCGFLQERLGFSNGLEEELDWGTTERIEIWLAEGSEKEDAGDWFDQITSRGRFMNHFHNPLKAWEDAGLNVGPGGIINGQSSLLWAQDSNNQFQSKWPEPPEGGVYSWGMVRLYYYFSLTSKNDAERQAYLAQTFRGVGQQIHLLQDKAVPAHVRNDAHPFTPGIEKWATKNQIILQCLFEDASNPDCSSLGIASVVNIHDYYPKTDFSNHKKTVAYTGESREFSLAPSAMFIDADVYEYIGDTVSLPSINLAQGLAEYTNSNFFSDDTIFTENRNHDDLKYFPYPRRESTNIAQLEASQVPPKLFTAKDQVQDRLLYVEKTSEGEQIEHFARIGFLWEHLGKYTPLALRHLILDDECHKDYAKKLIPRAVGYSAGLIDYFFRGTIEITPPEQFAYAVIDGSVIDPDINSQIFPSIKMNLRNTTSNSEIMGQGQLYAVAKYKRRTDYLPDMSANEPPTQGSRY